ncbi:MAG: hypothetical protein HDR00_05550 [Lachnospiraceae bacterium]|nr:hypothetical protein [Lachnospiraceae bacterium]
MDNKLLNCRKWLINDQYEHGEFGKHEIANPTDLPRTFDESLLKPNVFSSIVAYSTLIVTGKVPIAIQRSFHEWIEKIRANTGYWTSASGSVIPFSSSAGWARSNNLRHTAKCLDYYLLHGKFSYQDAVVFNEIIRCQLEDGSFPQFKGMNSDLWSTAYFANLLIRATLPQNLKMTLPWEENENTWRVQLDNRLNRAIDWLLFKLENDYMWHIQDADTGIVTIAMMAEIGGYLALHKRETCAAIIRKLIRTQSTTASLVYVACLAMDTLQPQEQIIVRRKYEEIIDGGYDTPVDLIDATSLCKLIFLKRDIGTLLYYRNISNGHESQMIIETEWNYSDYFRWALCSTYDGQYQASEVPLQEADFWQYVNQSICKIKWNIENSRGWELLWNDGMHVNEKKVQVYLNELFQVICESDNVSVSREQETGRGPIDFIFSNNFVGCCILEVKLAFNQALKNGDFLVQVYEYAKGLKVSSAFLVVVGFTSDEYNIMRIVNTKINLFREMHDDFYIQAIYVNASKKQGASKVSLKTISVED